MKENKRAIEICVPLLLYTLFIITTGNHIDFPGIVTAIAYSIFTGTLLLFAVSVVNYRIAKKREMVNLNGLRKELCLSPNLFVLTNKESDRIKLTDINKAFLMVQEISSKLISQFTSYHDGLFWCRPKAKEAYEDLLKLNKESEELQFVYDLIDIKGIDTCKVLIDLLFDRMFAEYILFAHDRLFGIKTLMVDDEGNNEDRYRDMVLGWEKKLKEKYSMSLQK